MFYRLKNCVATALALAACLLFGTFAYAKNSVRLNQTEGERVFYLDSASSQGLMKSGLCLSDLPRIKGESVCFEHRESPRELAEKILKEYGAELVFTEEACGVLSYYGYSAKLGEPIILTDRAVNLHVAVTESRIAVGTPIIFGGF